MYLGVKRFPNGKKEAEKEKKAKKTQYVLNNLKRTKCKKNDEKLSTLFLYALQKSIILFKVVLVFCWKP